MPSRSNFNAECLDKPNTTLTIQQIALLNSAQYYILVEPCVHKHLLLYGNSDVLVLREKLEWKFNVIVTQMWGPTKDNKRKRKHIFLSQ